MKSFVVLAIAFFAFPCVSLFAKENEEKKDGSSPPHESPKTEQTREKPFDFSGTGRPGQQTAGESRGSCDLEQSFQAVIPSSNTGKTVMGHPKFWIYFANPSNKIDRLEFILQNEAREDVWRAPIPLDSGSSAMEINHVKSGYKNLSLPSTEPPLTKGQWYRWYVKAYCKSQVASSYFVQGWINRIPISSVLNAELNQKHQRPYEVYGNHGIWYDAVNHILQTYHNSPNNLDLEEDWQKLIEAGGLGMNQLPAVTTIFRAKQ